MKANDIFQKLSDCEGVAYVDLNRSFLYLERKDLTSAKESFLSALEIAYPFPSIQEREEMKNIFIDRSKKNGFDEKILRSDELLGGLLFN